MKITLLIILSSTIIWICKTPFTNTEIKFVNHSSKLVDSLNILIVSKEKYETKLNNIKPGDSTIQIIPENTPQSNAHDIAVVATVYIKGKDAINIYDYNDLSGYLKEQYTILLDSNIKLSIRSIFKS